MIDSPRLSASTLGLLSLLATAGVGAAAAPGTGAPHDIVRGDEAMRSPVAIAIAGDRVYVADFDDDRVRIQSRAGADLGGWGAAGSGPGEFSGPAGIAVGPDGSVLVTDLYNHRVQRFTPDGGYLGEWIAGEADAAPFGIAVDRAGRVHVGDMLAGRVGVWGADGRSLTSWGAPGRARGELREPWGIAVDAAGDVLVADHGNHRIQRFSSEGVWLGAWGEPGTGEGQLLGPMGLAVGADGSVVVSDLAGDRLRRFTPGGELLAVWRGAALGAQSPAPGLALDHEGTVFLLDTARQRVSRLPGSVVRPSSSAPSDFALLRMAQPLGRGPVTLELAIPGPGTVRAEFFSLDGRRVRQVPATVCDAGVHRITWDAATDDGHRAPVGVYFVRVQFDDGVHQLGRSGRVVVLR